MAEKVKEKPNMVQQDALFIETVRKEQRLQSLHTEFNFNPRRKLHVLPDKPMSRKPPEVIMQSTEYIEAYRKAQEEPRKKYLTPQTESQETGWWSTPLIQTNRNDRRLHFQRVNSDVTKHKELLLRSAAQT
ncbi:cilia- and flagella-associated protein 144 [Halichoeres trimaculatus]|uniref:cilia- and flagella-associated protein 144 n=1 Tax=Halichoeres trimaculatus TaxID=147232 RepID=UPI003D9E2A2E